MVPTRDDSSMEREGEGERGDEEVKGGDERREMSREGLTGHGLEDDEIIPSRASLGKTPVDGEGCLRREHRASGRKDTSTKEKEMMRTTVDDTIMRQDPTRWASLERASRREV